MADTSSAVPSPGSDEAVMRGCTCPVMDNSRGQGYLGTGQFWIAAGCPIHAWPRRETDAARPAPDQSEEG